MYLKKSQLKVCIDIVFDMNFSFFMLKLILHYCYKNDTIFFIEIESQEDMYYNQIEDIPEVPESLYNEAALESNNQPLISYILDNTGGTENWRPVEIIQTVNESTLDTSPVMNQEKSNQEISITHTNETLSLEYST